MNKKHLIIGFILLFSVSSYGQVQNNMNKLVTQCATIVEFSQQITQLKDSIRNANQKVLELRKDWEKTCNDYLASDEQTSEDFQYLINNTDSIIENALYLKLVEASRNVKVSNENNKKEPVINQEPAPIESDNDGKEPEKKENKGEKKKDKKESPTTPVKNSKGDMDDDLKSKISNKGKK